MEAYNEYSVYKYSYVICVCVFAICLRLLSLTKTNIKKKELTLFSFFFITYIWDIFKEHLSFLCSSLHNRVTYWFRRPSRDPGEADLSSRKIACRSTVLEHDSILCTVHHSELASTKCFPPLQRGLFIFHVKWCKLCTYFPCCCIMALTLIHFFLNISSSSIFLVVFCLALIKISHL